MDAAPHLLARLERIGSLRHGGAQASALLTELRALLAEGEACLGAASGGGLAACPSGGALTASTGPATLRPEAEVVPGHG